MDIYVSHFESIWIIFCFSAFGIELWREKQSRKPKPWYIEPKPHKNFYEMAVVGALYFHFVWWVVWLIDG